MPEIPQETRARCSFAIRTLWPGIAALEREGRCTDPSETPHPSLRLWHRLKPSLFLRVYIQRPQPSVLAAILQYAHKPSDIPQRRRTPKYSNVAYGVPVPESGWILTQIAPDAQWHLVGPQVSSHTAFLTDFDKALAFAREMKLTGEEDSTLSSIRAAG